MTTINRYLRGRKSSDNAFQVNREDVTIGGSVGLLKRTLRKKN